MYKDASTFNEMTQFLNEHKFFDAVFNSVIFFVSFITTSKIIFVIFLTYDL